MVRAVISFACCFPEVGIILQQFFRIPQVFSEQHRPPILELLLKPDKRIRRQLSAAAGFFQFGRVINQMDFGVHSFQQ